MPKYIVQEMNDLHGTGQKKSYVRMDLVRNLSFEEFLELSKKSMPAVSKVAMEAAINHVVSNLAFYMGMGYSVKIDGLGTFRAKIGKKKSRKTKTSEKETYKPDSLCVTGVIFRADKKLVANTDKECELERGGKAEVEKSPYTREERLQLALDFLDKHSVMHTRDYMNMTNLPHSTATKELNTFCKDAESGITYHGRKSTKVYIRASKND